MRISKPANFFPVLPLHKLFATSGAGDSTATIAAHFRRLVDTTSISSWNSAIADLARAGDAGDALRAFVALRRLHVVPDRSSFPHALKSSAGLADLSVGRQLHLLALRLGLHPDLFVASALVDMYAKCRRPWDARQVFDETPQPNAVVWTAMVAGYAFNGDAKDAIFMFKGLLADEGATELDSVATVAALTACARLAGMGGRRVSGGVHGVLVKVGLEMEVRVGNTLIDAYVKGGNFELGRKMFDEMPVRDVVSWNTMIALYAQNGMSVEALELYNRMLSEGIVKYNAVTMSAVLLACAHAGALQTGKCVHDQVVRMGLEEDLYVGTSVVDMYCKCGRVQMARKAFNRMKERNILSWSAMIAGYGMHGHGREALDTFDEMRSSGVKPNYITFISVLAACSHSGLFNEGQYWLQTMKREFGINPGVEHYGCMVDLLGRAGRLDEAYELIKEMEVKPDFVVWGALLAACRIHKNVELGEIAANKLFELDPTDCGYYVLLSNIYADAGRWTDVQRLRILMKNRGLVKPPGYSLVELKGNVHVFLVGDMKHPLHKEIYSYLETLRCRMLEAGFVPDTSSVLHDLDEEEKETVLQVHSEKLAVAFAIISTPPGTTIHIIKNLRVCGDCHSAIKLIAKLVGREIVVRDSHRFHHFKDEKCSCGDYW